MEFDIFFSISQTPVDELIPSEKEMFKNFFEQVRAADQLGFKTAWVAESHYSSQSQKLHKQPVIPHWDGEVGLNNDIFQLAHLVFAQTTQLEVGSAVMNIVCNGGPLPAAERVASFCTLREAVSDNRRLHLGFSAGRFEFMNRSTGIMPRSDLEVSSWPTLRPKIFREACEIFLRLTNGEEISSDDIEGLGVPADTRTWWRFEKTKVIPQHWNRELFVPVLGSHDPELQKFVNHWRPVKVFNLSITQPKIIEETHKRLKEHYHWQGGPWLREYMPRTVFVFLNNQKHLSGLQQSAQAKTEAEKALSAYWRAIDGTLDPQKVSQAANNALIGNANEIAEQIRQRFHPHDKLMLWFDFFNHNSNRVMENMSGFMKEVKPMLSSMEKNWNTPFEADSDL